MTVRELITLLSRVDQNAEVWAEYDGSAGPLDHSEIRVVSVNTGQDSVAEVVMFGEDVRDGRPLGGFEPNEDMDYRHGRARRYNPEVR